jgi:Bacterial membrane protein YfhO
VLRLLGSKSFSPFVGIISLAWLIYCWHWLGGADVIPFDNKLTYFQLSSWVVDCYRAGALPLWDPYFMSGFPACADPQIHCFYLFAMPFFALLGPLNPVWFDRIELLHILAAGIGIYFLAREFRMSPSSAAVTALVVMFGGSASARLQHTGMIYAYGLLPLCLLLTKWVFERKNWLYVPALGVVAGSMGILGDQVAFLNCLVVAAFASALIIQSLWSSSRSSSRASSRSSSKKGVVLPCFRLLIAGIITLLVMLPQIIPTTELLPLSSRPWIPLENLRAKSLYRWSFLTCLIPDIFRTFDGYANYIGKNDPSETYLYLGLLPATIFAYGGILKGLLFRKTNLWFLLPLLFFLLYALGTQTPAYAFFWNFVPGVKSFQRPTDATFSLNVFLAVLLGFILDSLRGRRSNPQTSSYEVFSKHFGGEAFFALSFSLLTVLATIFLCKFKVPHVLLQNNTLALIKIGVLVFVGMLLLRALERCNERGIQNLLIATIAFFSFCDLQLVNSSNYLNTAREQDYAYTDPAALAQHPALVALSQLRSTPANQFRVEMLGSEKENEWWNASNHLQVESTDGMWPINLLSYHQYSGACNPIFGRRFNHWMSGFDSPLFDLLNVKYVLTNYSEDQARSVLSPSKFKRVSTLRQYSVYENTKVLPRCMLLSHYKLCQSFGELAGVMRSAKFDPSREVILLADDFKSSESEQAELKSLSMESGTVTTGDRVSYSGRSANSQKLSIHCAGDRILLLGDIYFPGWSARVDGKSVEIVRADYLFRAVLVPKGDHSVQFTYNPYSVEALKETSRLAQTH